MTVKRLCLQFWKVQDLIGVNFKKFVWKFGRRYTYAIFNTIFSADVEVQILQKEKHF